MFSCSFWPRRGRDDFGEPTPTHDGSVSIIAILLVELAGRCLGLFALSGSLSAFPVSRWHSSSVFCMPIGLLEFVGFAQRRRDATADTMIVPARQLLPVRAARTPVSTGSRKRAIAPIRVLRKTCEVTAVVCDIANKHDLAEECEPAAFVEIVEKFLAQATEAFRKAGAYIESAGGEGVVAIFGFPESDKQHAEKAARTAMALTQAFLIPTESGKSDAPASVGVHAGVSSGKMIMAPCKNNGQRGLLATGEPVELARRFCIANRFYGSRVLLGPRTFELASKILVARPIDFLSGVDVAGTARNLRTGGLALDATRDQITRRDAFWNGVVLYREKRWAEAYAQFQNAREPGR